MAAIWIVRVHPFPLVDVINLMASVAVSYVPALMAIPNVMLIAVATDVIV